MPSPSATDPANNQALFGVDGAALELRARRMGLITANIANASTPGFKARDLNFTAALKAELAGTTRDKAAAQATGYRVPLMPSLDGNTVDMGVEQAAFGENATGYATALAFIGQRVDMITRAIKGE